MRALIEQAVKLCAAAADAGRQRSGMVVLIYHRVGGHTPVPVDLPTGVFADQMSYLVETCRPVTIDGAADQLSRLSSEGSRSVCVTFDDGTADFVEEALPVLVEKQVPAVVYIATDHVERSVPFPAGGTPISWSALADALSTGLVTVGSHTHTHRLLDRAPPAEAADELDRSIELIGGRLGVACRHFAYPKALLARPDTESEVRRRFRTAAIGRTRPNRYGATDLHRITRSPVQVSDGMRWFQRKVAGGLALESDLRDLVNRRRYAGKLT